jgi:peptidoglycan/LPS O-acetylase OafA/YrhL
MAEWGTHVRAPEIAAGVILACALFLTKRQPSGSAADLLGWSAFATLLALFVFATKTQWWLFHGGFALVSVVSVGVLIGLLSGGSFSRILGWRPLAFLGTMSYAIYLVHWPVRVAITPERIGEIDSLPLALLRLTVSLALATVLHFLVERPFMRRFPASPRTVFATWIVASVFVTVLAYALLK